MINGRLKAYVAKIPKLDPFNERNPHLRYGLTASKVRYQVYLELQDIYPDLKIMDIHILRAKGCSF